MQKTQFTLKVSEYAPLEAGKTITRFLPRGKVAPGTTVNLKTKHNNYITGEVIDINDNKLFGDKVIGVIRKR